MDDPDYWYKQWKIEVKRCNDWRADEQFSMARFWIALFLLMEFIYFHC